LIQQTTVGNSFNKYQGKKLPPMVVRVEAMIAIDTSLVQGLQQFKNLWFWLYGGQMFSKTTMLLSTNKPMAKAIHQAHDG